MADLERKPHPMEKTVLAELRAIREAKEQLRRDRLTFISRARLEGKSWRQIGDALGMNREGARSWYERNKPVVDASEVKRPSDVLRSISGG